MLAASAFDDRETFSAIARARSSTVESWNMRRPGTVIFAQPCVRRTAAASTIVCLLLSALVVSSNSKHAFAQAKQETNSAAVAPKRQFFPVKQIRLTERHIKGYLSAKKEINSITDNAGEGIDKLSPATIAKLDVVARKNGLADYDEYTQVGENLGLVSSGFDEVTKRYVGRDAVIKIRIARVKANKKMSADERQEALTDLNDQLQFDVPAVAYKGNIDLFVRYHDRID